MERWTPKLKQEQCLPKWPHQPPHLSGDMEPLADRMMTGNIQWWDQPLKSRQDAPFNQNETQGEQRWINAN